MDKKLKYLLGAILVAVLGFVVLVLSTTFRSSMQYYVTVSELMADQPKYARHALKVAGHASAITTEGQRTYHFSVDEGGQSLPVTFTGLAPDTFKEGSEVVVTGRLNRDGTFTATDVLAKCSSKYEARMEPSAPSRP